MDIETWIERILSGERRALARGLTEVENRGPHAGRLLAAVFPHSGRSRRIGVTGAPGAGKSTLVNQLVGRYRRQGKSVAVVAVDPTSPFTGGSILGDRIRMQEHHADAGVYVRSMATRGSLGGLAAATADVVTVLEASGRDPVLIETVGVGQAEVDIVRLAPAVALVVTPSMGDSIQTIKAGVMEIADVFVINKADQPGAEDVEQQLQAMLHLAPAGGAPPPIVRTVATEGSGIEELAAHLEAIVPRKQAATGYWKERILVLLRERALEELLRRAVSPGELEAAAQKAARRELNPYEFVEEVLQKAKMA